MRHRFLFGAIDAAVLLCALALCVAAPDASAQLAPMSKGSLPAIDARVQGAVIDSVAAALNEAYVFADKAARMDSVLHANLAAGAYRDLTDPVEFVLRLQADIATVYLDRHMTLMALPLPPPGARVAFAGEGAPAMCAPDPDQSRRENFGFKKAELLDGNVGYLKLDKFVNTDLAGPTAMVAMNFLANADALIIDLRDNGGGNASMIQLLAGYLFENRTHLVDWYRRVENKTYQSWSDDWVPGKTMFEIPVYVLVSSFTGSAAEEFTYDLQNEKRATIVGETTGGAAHTVEYRTYDVGSFLAVIKLPSGRAISPVTGTNWEATGVKPDIAVAADKALAAAHLDALKKLEENAGSDGAKFAIRWAREGLEAEREPYILSAKALREYAGTFGPRKLFMEGSRLMYQREGGPKMALVPMRKDFFRLEGANIFRIRFTRDDAGRIDGLVGLYDNGREEPNPRTK